MRESEQLLALITQASRHLVDSFAQCGITAAMREDFVPAARLPAAPAAALVLDDDESIIDVSSGELPEEAMDVDMVEPAVIID